MYQQFCPPKGNLKPNGHLTQHLCNAIWTCHVFLHASIGIHPRLFSLCISLPMSVSERIADTFGECYILNCGWFDDFSIILYFLQLLSQPENRDTYIFSEIIILFKPISEHKDFGNLLIAARFSCFELYSHIFYFFLGGLKHARVLCCNIIITTISS